LTHFRSLKDLVIRTETNKLVTDLVNLDRVRSLLKMISHRRRFLAHREQQLRMRMEQHGESLLPCDLFKQVDLTRTQDIPSIVVDVLPVTPPTSSRDIASGQDPTAVSDASSPSLDRYYQSPRLPSSPVLSMRTGLQRKRTSEGSMLSTDLGSKFS
jgi:hypothetical protein